MNYPEIMSDPGVSTRPAPESFFKSLLESVPRGVMVSLAALGAMSIGIPWWAVLAWIPIYGIMSYTRFSRQERHRREAKQAETFAQ